MQSEMGSSAACDSPRRPGFLTRLRRDARGNTLAIVGAALVPLSAMIGSGVDMSRAYMAKNRLQSACDAAALAGRRVMTNDTLDSNVVNEATRFFRFNFPQGLYGTATFTPAVTKPTSGTVRVTASTTIPTTIMHMFGFNTLPLNVTCDASLNFVNTDVMLVLDVTGSMAEDVNGNSTSNTANQKIQALRDAVMALYDTLTPIQTQLQANGLRLRYGVVPYSSTVNVGALIRSVNADYLVDNATYQSRVANFNNRQTDYVGTQQPPSSPVSQTYASALSQSDCDKYGRNVTFSGFTPSATNGGGPAPTATWTRTFSNDESTGVDWGWSGAADTSGSSRSCRRRYVETDTTFSPVYHWESSGWTYKSESVDVSDYKMGTPVAMANDDAGESPVSGTFDPIEIPGAVTGESTTNVTWNGCIEERDTVNTITPTSNYNLPTGAYDLDINLIPYDDHTRWRPMFPQLEYSRSAGNTTSSSGSPLASAACPAAAVRLQNWTRSALLSYVNALTPTGSTYHDAGMRWGVRMLSNAGIFADSPDTFNAMPVARNIIFLTDGQMDTDPGIYGSYGVEKNDQRISGMSNPSESELNGRHNTRFRMMCNTAKSMNISIWVIALGTTLSSDMLGCASNANQASTIANRDALIARFQQIGNNIGALRLTQ
jgi:Flp pilus assembly protein TadG